MAQKIKNAAQGEGDTEEMTINKNFIAGSWAESTETIRDINPSNTDDVVGEYAAATADQVGQAIAAAHAAFPRHAGVAGAAPAGLELAMHMEQPPRPGPLVQVVDILGDDQQLARPSGIEPGQRPVRVIGLDPRQILPPRIVEAVHQHRIARERLGRRHVFDAMALPQAIRTTKGCKAALR